LGLDTTDYAQLTYTHTLPGAWQWLSLTIGQYPFSLYDGNQYAGDGQANFVNYALAQNATQTYGSGGLGAYLEAAAPARNLVFAGGFQDATNPSGSTITAHGIGNGKFAYFLAARWTPEFLADGSYGLLWYAEPALPEDELPASHGLSFNAVQNLNAQWGLFVRANAASGVGTTIGNSVAGGSCATTRFTAIRAQHRSQPRPTSLLSSPRHATSNGSPKPITVVAYSRACGSPLTFSSISRRPWPRPQVRSPYSRCAPLPHSEPPGGSGGRRASRLQRPSCRLVGGDLGVPAPAFWSERR
jgi:hypothetical protein